MGDVALTHPLASGENGKKLMRDVDAAIYGYESPGDGRALAKSSQSGGGGSQLPAASAKSSRGQVSVRGEGPRIQAAGICRYHPVVIRQLFAAGAGRNPLGFHANPANALPRRSASDRFPD